jgi:hypothetical protein
MVRRSNHLVGSAAELWVVLGPAPGGDAAADRLPDRPQPPHRVRARRASRRGKFNLADDVIANTNRAVARQHNSTSAMSRDQSDSVTKRIAGVPPSSVRSLIPMILPQED